MKNPDSKINVLLVDDHQIVLDGLRRVLEDEDDIHICACAFDGKEALEVLKHTPTDVMVLDYRMPKMDGQEVLKHLKKEYPNIKSIVLSFSEEGKHIHAAMQAGAKGYVIKNRTAQDLVEAIRKVQNGGKFFPPEVFEALTQYLDSGEDHTEEPEEAHKLSPRESEVIACMMAGLTSKEIADVLCISKTTVETHKQKIMRRFGFQNSNQVVIMGEKRGIQAWVKGAKKPK